MTDEFLGRAEPLTQAGFDAAIAALAVEPASLWSVVMVETRGCGFLPNRRPKILFERHIFHERTNGKFDATHPDISHPDWGGYGKDSAQYDRLARAMELNRQAALESASWGLPQIMGFNAVSIGYASAEDMIKSFTDSESAQLEGMVRFLKTNKLVRALADKTWATLARHYNGPDFAKNHWDTKLADFHRKLVEEGLPDIELRADQIRLAYLGFDPNGIDGVLGKGTERALRAFQEKHNPPASGQRDDATRARLKEVAGI
jgi:hypothetical protein